MKLNGAHHVAAINAARAYPHQHLSRAGRRHWQLAQFKLGTIRGLADPVRFHETCALQAFDKGRVLKAGLKTMQAQSRRKLYIQL